MAREGARWLWLALAVLAADRATKYAIERFTSDNYRRQLVPHFADLVHSMNPGIAFGAFSDPASRGLSLFIIASAAIVVVALAWLLLSGRAGDVLAQAGLALIAGGAAGNLLDRILHSGVTDFLELHAGRFEWPAFNLADSAITIGALLVAWELLSGGRRARAERV